MTTQELADRLLHSDMALGDLYRFLLSALQHDEKAAQVEFRKFVSGELSELMLGLARVWVSQDQWPKEAATKFGISQPGMSAGHERDVECAPPLSSKVDGPTQILQRISAQPTATAWAKPGLLRAATVLARNGHVLRDALALEHITHSELIEALRREGCTSLSRVRFAVLETDGSITIGLRCDRWLK